MGGKYKYNTDPGKDLILRNSHIKQKYKVLGMSESSKTCRNYVSSAKICSASYFEDTSLAESPGKRGRRLRKGLRRYSKYSKGIAKV